MLRRAFSPRLKSIARSSHTQPGMRLAQMAAHLDTNDSTSASNGTSHTLSSLPKSNVFTSNLPADPAFLTPSDSHSAPREKLGPRLVKEAIYTYVRPEITKSPEVLCVSSRALQDLGLNRE